MDISNKIFKEYIIPTDNILYNDEFMIYILGKNISFNYKHIDNLELKIDQDPDKHNKYDKLIDTFNKINYNFYVKTRNNILELISPYYYIQHVIFIEKIIKKINKINNIQKIKQYIIAGINLFLKPINSDEEDLLFMLSKKYNTEINREYHNINNNINIVPDPDYNIYIYTFITDLFNKTDDKFLVNLLIKNLIKFINQTSMSSNFVLSLSFIDVYFLFDLINLISGSYKNIYIEYYKYMFGLPVTVIFVDKYQDIDYDLIIDDKIYTNRLYDTDQIVDTYRQNIDDIFEQYYKRFLCLSVFNNLIYKDQDNYQKIVDKLKPYQQMITEKYFNHLKIF